MFWVFRHRFRKLAGRMQLALSRRRVAIGEGCRFIGLAHMEYRRDAVISLGRNVTLNSSSIGYHGHMPSPVKLLADRPGSVIEIGDNCRIHGACVHAWRKVSIGRNCLIAAGTQIMDANGHRLSMNDPEARLHERDEPRPVSIGDNVWIGMNVIVLPGSEIGDGAVISANSVVSGVIPPGVVAGGNPAQIWRKA